MYFLDIIKSYLSDKWNNFSSFMYQQHKRNIGYVNENKLSEEDNEIINSTNAKQVLYNKVLYNSISEAARMNNVSRSTVKRNGVVLLKK